MSYDTFSSSSARCVNARIFVTRLTTQFGLDIQVPSATSEQSLIPPLAICLPRQSCHLSVSMLKHSGGLIQRY